LEIAMRKIGRRIVANAKDGSDRAAPDSKAEIAADCHVDVGCAENRRRVIEQSREFEPYERRARSRGLRLRPLIDPRWADVGR